MNTIVYIDGFNLYYAIRSSGCKWLNIKTLAEGILSQAHTVAAVKYYTARVSGATDPDQPKRQQIFFSALQTVPEIEIFFGKFLAKNVWRPVVNLPAANRSINVGQTNISFPAGDYQVQPDQLLHHCRTELLSIGSYPNGSGNASFGERCMGWAF